MPHKVRRGAAAYKCWFRRTAGRAAVKLEANLSELNRRLASAVREMFSDDVTAEQSADGELHVRGPHPRDRSICTHVTVRIEADVHVALDFATPLMRELMIRRVVERLAAQVRARYDRTRPGESPLCLVGTAQMLD